MRARLPRPSPDGPMTLGLSAPSHVSQENQRVDPFPLGMIHTDSHLLSDPSYCLESPDSFASGKFLFCFQSGGSAPPTTKAPFANPAISRAEQFELARAHTDIRLVGRAPERRSG